MRITRRSFEVGSQARPGFSALLLACAAGAACLPAFPALAGGGEENAFIIIDPGNAESMYIGNYYKNARNIPDCNVLYIEPDSANYAAFVANVLPGLAGQLANARLGDHIDYIVVTPGNSFYVSAPGYVTDGCFAVSRFAMSSAFTMAFVTGDILPGSLPSTNSNRYFTTATICPPLAFDSNTAWLSGSASTSASARRYYIGAMLGWNDPPGTPVPLGNTPAQIVAMIDRSVGADGTRPAGTFYYMNNDADSARNVRACGAASCPSGPTLFNAAVTRLAALGGLGQVINGITPVGMFDCLGVMTGAANPEIEVSNAVWSLLPGSFCDHLTSYAGMLDVNSQRKVSAWIRKGASGSAGTVEEPCNYTGKFPHSRIFPYYVQGMTLGEAYLRNQQYTPFQNLFYGDPLTRPFTYIPAVSVGGVPGGAASGTVVLTPSATTARPSTAIAGFDLLIDGVLHSAATPGGTFSVDTTRLADGWHDLRVLAYDNTVTKSMGRWVGGFTTDNRGRATGLSALIPSGDLSTTYQFNVTPSGGTVSEARLLLNGKVVASGTGVVSVKGQSLGAGTVWVQAETTFADGAVARSPRAPVTIAYASGTPGGAPPAAFSYTKAVVRNSPFVVELPASLDTDPAGATYTLVTAPAQATVTAGGTRGYRLLTPIGSPCGIDTLVFNVTTSGGVSNNATVTIVYTPPFKACPADFNDDGFMDGIDYDQFMIAFETGLVTADFNNDCFIDGIDYDQFVALFEHGC